MSFSSSKQKKSWADLAEEEEEDLTVPVLPPLPPIHEDPEDDTSSLLQGSAADVKEDRHEDIVHADLALGATDVVEPDIGVDNYKVVNDTELRTALQANVDDDADLDFNELEAGQPTANNSSTIMIGLVPVKLGVTCDTGIASPRDAFNEVLEKQPSNVEPAVSDLHRDSSAPSSLLEYDGEAGWHGADSCKAIIIGSVPIQIGAMDDIVEVTELPVAASGPAYAGLNTEPAILVRAEELEIREVVEELAEEEEERPNQVDLKLSCNNFPCLTDVYGGQGCTTRIKSLPVPLQPDIKHNYQHRTGAIAFDGRSSTSINGVNAEVATYLPHNNYGQTSNIATASPAAAVINAKEDMTYSTKLKHGAAALPTLPCRSRHDEQVRRLPAQRPPAGVSGRSCMPAPDTERQYRCCSGAAIPNTNHDVERSHRDGILDVDQDGFRTYYHGRKGTKYSNRRSAAPRAKDEERGSDLSVHNIPTNKKEMEEKDSQLPSGSSCTPTTEPATTAQYGGEPASDHNVNAPTKIMELEEDPHPPNDDQASITTTTSAPASKNHNRKRLKARRKRKKQCIDVEPVEASDVSNPSMLLHAFTLFLAMLSWLSTKTLVFLRRFGRF